MAGLLHAATTARPMPPQLAGHGNAGFRGGTARSPSLSFGGVLLGGGFGVDQALDDAPRGDAAGIGLGLMNGRPGWRFITSCTDSTAKRSSSKIAPTRCAIFASAPDVELETREETPRKYRSKSRSPA